MYTSDDITKQISTGEFRAVVRHSNATNAVVKTTIRLRFDCNSTALRPFDDISLRCYYSYLETK